MTISTPTPIEHCTETLELFDDDTYGPQEKIAKLMAFAEDLTKKLAACNTQRACAELEADRAQVANEALIKRLERAEKIIDFMLDGDREGVAATMEGVRND